MVTPLARQGLCTQLFVFAGLAEEWLLRRGLHLPSARVLPFTVLPLLVGRQVRDTTMVLGS